MDDVTVELSPGVSITVSRQLWDEVGPWRQAAADRIEQIDELLRSMDTA